MCTLSICNTLPTAGQQHVIFPVSEILSKLNIVPPQSKDWLYKATLLTAQHIIII